jgi:hypothetical protein
VGVVNAKKDTIVPVETLCVHLVKLELMLRKVLALVSNVLLESIIWSRLLMTVNCVIKVPSLPRQV